MATQIGQVEQIFRYPVKSMRGERLETATVGWHGLDGDRRLAFRRLEAAGGFPWLTASKLPELVLFTPEREGSSGDGPPTHVRTPEGREMRLFDDALATDVSRRHGAPVQLMELKHGIFDDATISIITSATIGEIGRLAASDPDARRFRPNIVIRAASAIPFAEDGWLGGVLAFGDGDGAPAVAVTMPDARCAMVNIDPDRGRLDPEVLKAVVRANGNNAGIYGTVTQTGKLAIGQPVFFHRRD